MLSTTSLITSQMLRDAGFPQETHIFWEYGHPSMKGQWEQKEWYLSDYYVRSEKSIASPSVDEILDKIPKNNIRIDNKMMWLKIEITSNGPTQLIWCVGCGEYNKGMWISKDDTILVEALAKFWLYLNQQGLLEKKNE